MSDSVLPIFSSKSFIISGLIFSSKWFEFIFVCGVRKYYFILLHVAIQVLPGPLIEETVFSPLYILASFVKDKLPVGAWDYLWALYLVPLVCIFVFVPEIYMVLIFISIHPVCLLVGALYTLYLK